MSYQCACLVTQNAIQMILPSRHQDDWKSSTGQNCTQKFAHCSDEIYLKILALIDICNFKGIHS